MEVNNLNEALVTWLYIKLLLVVMMLVKRKEKGPWFSYNITKMQRNCSVINNNLWNYQHPWQKCVKRLKINTKLYNNPHIILRTNHFVNKLPLSLLRMTQHKVWASKQRRTEEDSSLNNLSRWNEKSIIQGVSREANTSWFYHVFWLSVLKALIYRGPKILIENVQIFQCCL